MNAGRIDTLQCGTNQIGTPVRTAEGSAVRVDLYTAFADGQATPERRFAAGMGDFSRLFMPWAGDKYNATCAACFLGHSHTLDAHNAAIDVKTIRLNLAPERGE